MTPASRTNIDLIPHLQTGGDGKTKQPEGEVVRAAVECGSGRMRSEHCLESDLEELRLSDEPEPVERAVSVSEREPELERGVPSERRRHPPEFAALDGPA